MPFAWWRRRKKKRQEKQGLDERALMARLQPDMPDFLRAPHEQVFRDNHRLGVLVRDVPTIAESLLGRNAMPEALRITFPYALVVIDLESGLPEQVIALERGGLGSLCLCMYAGGAHLNFGDGEPYLDRDAFLARALEMIRSTREGGQVETAGEHDDG